MSIENFPPTRAAALARINAVRPSDYARSRNALEGAVTYLSPYITHGLVSLPEVLAGVTSRYPLDAQHKFVFELGWREYFHHVWQFREAGIFTNLHEGPLPESDYAKLLPADIRLGVTGVPVIDMAVRTLYDTGYLHNHARMWLASYIVHIRKIHWRCAADWLYGHLLDGDLASNHLSWQWVAGTGSTKPYLFNAENVQRYAPSAWHSPGSVIDQSYEMLDHIARQPTHHTPRTHAATNADSLSIEPPLSTTPPKELGWTAPDKATVNGHDVWLVHPWNLGELPETLPAGTVVVSVLLTDFHNAWPWSERRWRFVTSRMAELSSVHWLADAATIGAALSGARSVRSIDELHLKPWLSRLADCQPAPALFVEVNRCCNSFSKWWTQVSRGEIQQLNK
jgi:deoxyribodipyrimidine photo-lyase